jgi:hypothetical protein
VAQGGLTVGLDDRREGAPALYDLAVPRASYQTHAVDWYLDVLRRLGVPVHWDFEWLPRNEEAATVVESVWPANGHRWIALQPGARWLNKRWPAERFAALAQRLLTQDASARIVVLGEMATGRSARRFRRAGDRCLDLTGQLPLPGMVEWLRRCALIDRRTTPGPRAPSPSRWDGRAHRPVRTDRADPYRSLPGNWPCSPGGPPLRAWHEGDLCQCRTVGVPQGAVGGAGVPGGGGPAEVSGWPVG